MNTLTYIEKSNSFIAATYSRYPVILVKGSGCRVWDFNGREYIDFVSGLAVNNLGHCHPNVVKAICDQAEKLLHVSNLYHILPQINLAEILVENSFADRIFFCNSGAEANEAAIKLSRKYAKDNGDADRYEIITMKKSFHGRTLAAITATGQEKFHKGFEPLLPGFVYADFNNIEDVERAINKKTCAVLVEPIQGEGGVNIPSDNYLKELRALCNDKKLLLILDEVQTGMGRTGRLFAYQHYGIEPDIATLAKGLAGGVAIGAMLAKEDIAKSFAPGTHAATFGGNPLACSAGIASVKTILEEDITAHCDDMGKYFLERLFVLAENHTIIKEIRGKGLMIGMELHIQGKDIVTACMEKGFLINCTMDNILRFLPPLIVSKEEIGMLIDALDTVMSSFHIK